ncbi:SAM-dependent methyltransferase [[Phormidium ambiguum] IAM M-71]|uniref:SAM-dependent methyltransferase n=1 Tax=[Phormidium ambiguum] IAM M-71 TaxID=454136 RepID=A0A1U7IFJ1_9CYAN|nr:class I SAM-dependent methyltransferase [Phormidium ambiguum]OKH35740.1 SAM-dependent methyltransferase [Phormidium ambiguum IAM M-71]
MSNNMWNTTLYESNHSFVWQYGESLLELLAPQPDERILDLGCGTGQLTAKIASVGAKIWGIDADKSMIEQAQQNYPNLHWLIADARNFQVDEPLDAVFSNAALHWIKEADAVIQCVYQALKPGGRFVAEFGGRGNIGAIAQAIFTTLENMGLGNPQTLNPWYFPSIAEYATLLEKQQFEVKYALLFARPTPLEGGQAGIANWLQMFANGILSQLSPQQQMQVIQSVQMQLRPTLFRDGHWIADYRRIRIIAVK